MTLLLLALAVAFAAFCVWLTVRIVNRRERWAKWMLTGVLGMRSLCGAGLLSAVATLARGDESSDEQQARAPRFAIRDQISKKFGFVDRRGTAVLEPVYDSALDFEEGLARVQQSGELGFIDFTGALKFTLPAGTHQTTRVSEGRVWFLSDSNRWGLCDDQGRVVIEPQYDDVKPFSGGLAAVNVGARRRPRGKFMGGGQWGYVDKQGTVRISIEHEFARSFSEGLARVSDSKDTKFIDENGNIVIDVGTGVAGDFHEGVAPIRVDRSGKGKWQTQFVERTGKTAFTVEGYADDFHDGMAVVSVGATDSQGYVDRQGKLAIRPRFDEALDFNEGLAPVKTGTFSAKGPNWGYIDKSGEFRIQPEFNEAGSFRGGVAKVHIGGRRAEIGGTPAHAYWSGGEWWLIDAAGRKLTRLQM